MSYSRRARGQLFPGHWGHTEDCQDISAASQVDVFWKHAGNVEATGQNIAHDIDGQLRDDEDEAEEKRGSSTARAMLVLDCHEQHTEIPKRLAMAIFC